MIDSTLDIIFIRMARDRRCAQHLARSRGPHSSPALSILAICLCVGRAIAQTSLYSTSFSLCANSTNQFTVSSFNASITPGNGTLAYSLTGDSSFSGNDTINIAVVANGTEVNQSTVDPCIMGFTSLCPISSGPVNVEINEGLSKSATSLFPDDVVTSRELHAQVRLRLVDGATSQPFLCVEANLTNGLQQTSSNTTSPTSSSSSSPSGTTSTSSPTPTSEANSVSLNWYLSISATVILAFCTAVL